MTIIDTHAAYLSGTATPSGCIEQVLARIAAADRPEIWISRVDAPALPEAMGRNNDRQNALNRFAQREEHEFSGPRCVQHAQRA